MSIAGNTDVVHQTKEMVRAWAQQLLLDVGVAQDAQEHHDFKVGVVQSRVAPLQDATHCPKGGGGGGVGGGGGGPQVSSDRGRTAKRGGSERGRRPGYRYLISRKRSTVWQGSRSLHWDHLAKSQWLDSHGGMRRRKR